MSMAIRKCGSSERGSNLDSSIGYKTVDLGFLSIRKQNNVYAGGLRTFELPYLLMDTLYSSSGWWS